MFARHIILTGPLLSFNALEKPPLSLFPPMEKRTRSLHHWVPRAALMSAPPSPSVSSTPTLGIELELEEILEDLALPSPVASTNLWLQSLLSGGPMPTRQQLIGLFSALLQDRAMPALAPPNGATALVAVNAVDAILLQDDPPGNKKIPHLLVPKPGQAPEDAEWQQCGSKFTHVVVRLVNGQGEPLNGSTLQRAGLELELTLVNANTGVTLDTQGKLTGVAGGGFEPCAAASPCSLKCCLTSRIRGPP